MKKPEAPPRSWARQQNRVELGLALDFTASISGQSLSFLTCLYNRDGCCLDLIHVLQLVIISDIGNVPTYHGEVKLP